MSSETRPAPPAISLHLNNGDQTYRPGSSVTGTMTVKVPSPRLIMSASVQFTGKVVTHNKQRIKRNEHYVTYYYSHEVLFFDPSQTLESNTPTDESGTTVWDFSFKFPARVGGPLTPEPYPGKATSHGFYESGAHPLPPSFIYRKTGHDDYFAIVTYNLVASVQLDDERTTPLKAFLHPERFMAKDPYEKLFEVPLRSLAFAQGSPPGAYNVKLIQAFMPSQTYSSSRLTGQEKSRMSSLQDKFSKAPSVRFKVNYSFPSTLVPSQKFPIHASVEIDQFSEGSITVPTVELCITSLKLVPVTYYRTLCPKYDWEPELEVLEKTEMLLNARPDNAVVDLNDAINDSGKLIFATSFEARLPSDITPSFRTYNINRSYQVKIAVETTVCGKTFEHDYETPFEAVTIVAA